MGGTTEHAGNFVPVDERLVSFFVSQNQECRGRSPLPGCGARASGGCNSGLPQISFFLSPPQAARKARIIMNNIVQKDILQQLQQLQRDAQTALTQATTTEATREWYSEYLSRKGRLTGILHNLGHLTAEERPLVGRVAHDVKAVLENALQERQTAIAQAELEAIRRVESVDVTLPGRPQNLGKLHVTTRALRDIYAIFTAMGFQIYDIPELETDEYNFQLLNMPPGHPARDMWDTFYTTTPGLLLRTHTSPGQIHAMRAYAPNPVRVILPGKCYRYEQVTARSESMFYQVEGLAIGKRITFSDLKGVLTNFADQMYGEGRQMRFRKSYFPFTEPSVELDIECMLCGGKGCPICKYTG